MSFPIVEDVLNEYLSPLMVHELKKITIIGPGLIGGSIGLALKRINFSGRIVGVGRRELSLEQALVRKAIDEYTLDVHEGVKESDLVILCVGVGLIAPIGREAVEHIRQGCLLTDVGSAKSCVIRELAPAVPDSISYVSSHPLAGSEKRGVENAQADLFDDAICILTPAKPLQNICGASSSAKVGDIPAADDESDDSVEKLSGFWRALGCRATPMINAEEHDRIIAFISHLPHLVAAALVNTVTPESMVYAAGGFRDTTRIASGDPGLWRDVCAGNREEIVNALSTFSENILALIDALQNGNDEEILARLKEAKKKRGE